MSANTAHALQSRIEAMCAAHCTFAASRTM
jgi:hypothetical protein